MDIFYEETAACSKAGSEKRKYTLFRVLSIVFTVITVLWVLIIFFSFDFSKITEGSLLLNILFLVVPIAGSVGIAVGFSLLKNRCCLDYDYTFITGSIRISKVIREIKRKNLYRFECSQIEKIGKYGSDTFCGYENNKAVKKVIATSNSSPAEDKDFYYLAVNGLEESKVLLIIECTKTFIANIMKFTNRYVLEKDFK